MNTALYSCKFCKKRFYKERAFMAHTCTQMERSHEIQTIIGQQAYGLYKVWLEKQRKKPPAIDGFLTSSYYGSFIKFTNYIREHGIPDPEKYVELMVNLKLAPALWRRSECYDIYLDYADKKSSPYEQAAITVQTMMTLAEGLECPIGDVFKHFQPGEITELIQQRRLSPWLLFCSKSFKEWVSTLHEGNRSALMRHIGIHYWGVRFERSPDVIKSLREVAQDLGI